MSTDPSIQCFIYQFFTVALLIHSGDSCGSEGCFRNFKESLQGFGIIKGKNPQYCQLLTNLNYCLRSLNTKCWGAFYYHSSLTFVERENFTYNCADFPETALPKQEFPSRCFHYTEKVSHPVYRYCSLFGSRHLRTFNGTFQTCARSGAYPLYDGKHFAIQITHSSLSNAANAITMITVIIKECGNCTQQKFYEASSDDEKLMTAFVDGSTFSGNPKRKAVEIVAKNNTHTEIHIKHIATNITVKRRGPFLGVSLLIPEGIVQEFPTDVEALCTSGCSGGKLMEVKEALVKPQEFTQCHGTRLKTPIKIASDRCASVGVTDAFFDACVFDLMTTGNDLVVSVALDAQNDILERYPMCNKSGNSTHTGRTDFSIYQALINHRFSNCIVPAAQRIPSAAASIEQATIFLLFRLLVVYILVVFIQRSISISNVTSIFFQLGTIVSYKPI